MAIDYARMQKSYPKQKAALTRAKKKGYAAVLATCTATVKEWEEIGAWPDAWNGWQIALDDAFYAWQRSRGHYTPQNAPRLEDLHILHL
jgi:hypothetical protein